MSNIPAPALKIIEEILIEEGGWKLTQRVNDPDIATYGGMRFESLRDYVHYERGETLSLEHFLEGARSNDPALQEVILECYYDKYYIDGHVQDLPNYLRKAYYSCCVNVGLRNAGKILQRAMNADITRTNLTVDGIIGPKTLAILNNYPKAAELMDLFVDEWIRYYINIVQANSIKLLAKETQVNQAMNLEGWFNRATKYRYE